GLNSSAQRSAGPRGTAATRRKGDSLQIQTSLSLPPAANRPSGEKLIDDTQPCGPVKVATLCFAATSHSMIEPYSPPQAATVRPSGENATHETHCHLGSPLKVAISRREGTFHKLTEPGRHILVAASICPSGEKATMAGMLLLVVLLKSSLLRVANSRL